MLLLLLLATVAQDTTFLTPAAALERALDPQVGRLAVAAARIEAARGAGREFGAAANPTLQGMAENLGAQRQVTGRDGLAGTEGQITLGLPLTLGGDLGARRRSGAGTVQLAEAERDLLRADLRAEVLEAMALWERHRAVSEASRAERDALAAVAAAMTARAADGRDATASAALARVEAAAAASRHARFLADAARANAALAVLAHLPPGAAVALTPASCVAAAIPPVAATGSPEVAVLAAREEVASAGTALAQALRVPDLTPLVGFRRSAGFSGLLLGLSIDLPLRNAHAGALEAARAEEDAARRSREAEAELRQGAIDGHARALEVLNATSPRLGDRWREDLDAIVVAEATRLEVGEGSLYRLFDARRLRLAAITEAEDWRLEVRRQRIRLARRAGQLLDESVLCIPEVGP
ncbi:MAG: TolC family protein [Gemmatimonadetes bacterium]|nr:TolC family protein [Gemmatimonadota bacterium]MCA9761645.1 TolC family protein [Gemmatimonadota bacterium]MCB9505412.1 TolC family protein [Gemmatimonadales bacterium]HPF60633.1 TolC family protein [Gemmatimonadales bacterium]HRX18707.1 TolC family protein [Gemmatimonadales bacterium]